MSKAKGTQVYDAIESQRAEVVKALAEFAEAQNEELARFQKKQGKNAPGRAVDLPHDWYNDEETDSDQGRESPHGSCDSERSIDRGPGHVARREMRDEAEDPCRLMTPFDDRWNDDNLMYE